MPDNHSPIVADALLFFLAVPFIVLSLMFILPGKDVSGISMTQTDPGLVLNEFATWWTQVDSGAMPNTCGTVD